MVFYYVAQTGTVSAAARVLRLRQPTVSHQIKSLEEHYGVILFDRSQGKMVLTPEGQDMLNHAIDVFESVKETSETVEPQEYRTERQDHYHQHPPALIVHYLASFITQFHQTISQSVL